MRFRMLALAALLALTWTAPAADDRPTPAPAQLLTWDATLVERAGEPSQDAANARYRFRVTSAAPVTITVAKTSCGCTTARLEKPRWEPGEEGDIDATFEFGGFEGLQRKLITIEAAPADAGAGVDAQRTQLVLSATVPRLCTLQPTTLVWPKGGAGEERSVTVVEDRSGPIRLAAMKLVGKGFVASFPTVPAMPGDAASGTDGTYVFSVRPEATDRRASAACELVFDLGNGRKRSKHLFVHVDDR